MVTFGAGVNSYFVLFSSSKNSFCDIRKNTPKSYRMGLSSPPPIPKVSIALLLFSGRHFKNPYMYMLTDYLNLCRVLIREVHVSVPVETHVKLLSKRIAHLMGRWEIFHTYFAVFTFNIYVFGDSTANILPSMLKFDIYELPLTNQTIKRKVW